MNKESLKTLWQNVRKYLINKYVIVLAVFAVMLTFCGGSSLVSRIKNAHEISEKEDQLREYEDKIDATRRDLHALDDPDSLERYAREHYLMRADNEEVYLIKE